ncbi:hypothetical protein [Pantoea vagans]|uniref:hypothetical protein n=1 Tax=Pantoea vagans TaxID=470934 RepID=UPI003FA35718
MQPLAKLMTDNYFCLVSRTALSFPFCKLALPIAVKTTRTANLSGAIKHWNRIFHGNDIHRRTKCIVRLVIRAE